MLCQHHFSAASGQICGDDRDDGENEPFGQIIEEESVLYEHLIRYTGINDRVPMTKPKSFFWGVFSGAVEPVLGIITVFTVALVTSAMPYLLAFAAGAMIYVVVEELIPEMSAGEHSNIGVIAFAIGFSAMMALEFPIFSFSCC